MLRSRSFTRFTSRVGLAHLGQLVLFEVSITFLRSPVFAILAIFVTPIRAGAKLGGIALAGHGTLHRKLTQASARKPPRKLSLAPEPTVAVNA